MVFFRGMGFKVFVSIIAAIALIGGIYIFFFESSGFLTTTATIVSIDEDPDYIKDPRVVNDAEYIATVRYTVNGKTYTEVLDFYEPGFAVGKEVEIHYDPKNPAKIHGGRWFGMYLMIAGAVILFIVIFFTLRDRRENRKYKQGR